MMNEIDTSAEHKRFENWFAETWGRASDAIAHSTIEHIASRKNCAWGAWLAALTYGRQDAQPDADSDTIEVRIPVAVSDGNKYYAFRWHDATMNTDSQDVLTTLDESQVYIITARVPKYRIPEIAADRVEPVDTGDAT